MENVSGETAAYQMVEKKTFFLFSHEAQISEKGCHSFDPSNPKSTVNILLIPNIIVLTLAHFRNHGRVGLNWQGCRASGMGPWRRNVE